jgi:MoxR-like ATPase
VKLHLPAGKPLNWQPANWAKGETPTLGPFTYEVAPLPPTPEAGDILAKNTSDMAGIRVCFDQTTYGAYQFAFQELGHKQPVFFVGPPGTCKTFVISKLAVDVGVPLLKVPALDMDPVRARRILFGGLTTSGEAPWKILEHRWYSGSLNEREQAAVGEFKKANAQMKPDDWRMLADKLGYVSSVAHFEPGAITKGVKHGYIIFVDELNKFAPASLTDLSQLLSGQSIQIENGEWVSMLHAHPNFRLAFAMNQAGPLHPDREPLVRELMSRLSRNMMVVPELDANQERQFLMFQWLGEQPSIKVPDGRKFSAKAFEPAPVFKQIIRSQNTRPLRDLAEKYIKARAISRETSRKMETGENGVVPREHTTETWTYDRRDLITFSRDVLSILEEASDPPMARAMFEATVERHCTQHFQIYHLEKGPEVMTEFMNNARNLELFGAFDGMVQSVIHAEMTKADPTAVREMTRKLMEAMGEFKILGIGRDKPIAVARIPMDPGHPFRQGDKADVTNHAQLLEGLLLATKRITKADVEQARAAVKTNYPIGFYALDDESKFAGFLIKYPEFAGMLLAQETGLITIPSYIREQMLQLAPIDPQQAFVPDIN